MPQEPKRRHSRQRKGKRRASIRLTARMTVKCSNCGSFVLPHSICRICGFYKGRDMLKIKNKNENKTDEKSS